MTLQQLLNHNSFLLVAALAMTVALFVALRSGSWGVRLGVIGGVLLLLLAGHLLFRTGQNTLDTSEAADVALRSGKPSLVEFYSDF